MYEDGSVPLSVDRQLIRSAASEKRSPRELSNAVGKQLTPEQARARLETLLDESDWLTYVQERRLLVLNMRELLNSATKDAVTGGDANARRLYLDTLKAIGDRLDKTQINLDDVSEKIEEAHGRFWFASLAAGLQAMGLELERRGITIPKDEIVEVLTVGSDAGLLELSRNIATAE